MLLLAGGAYKQVAICASFPKARARGPAPVHIPNARTPRSITLPSPRSPALPASQPPTAVEDARRPELSEREVQ